MTAATRSASGDAVASLRTTAAALVIDLRGSWTIEQRQPSLEGLLASHAGTDAPQGAGQIRAMKIDASDLDAWDSSLLIFLLECRRWCAERHIALDESDLPEQATRLLALATAVPERVQPSVPPALPFLARFGQFALRWRDEFMAGVAFVGEVGLALVALVTRRARMRWREFWVVVQTNSAGALGIVTLIALLVGVIIAFLGVVVLQRFGAGYYVSYLVGFGMLREMAALMTGIIIAGRTGAAFAAELGSMKITEEIDAYTTLGISPTEHLVLPRLLGLFVVMPLLVIYADLVGILGGMFVSATMLELSVKQFMNGLLSAVTLSDALLGVFKGFVFGVIVGIAGCMKGLQTGSDASAVGRAATSAVVLGITGIITANAVVDWLAALLDV